MLKKIFELGREVVAKISLREVYFDQKLVERPQNFEIPLKKYYIILDNVDIKLFDFIKGAGGSSSKLSRN